MSAIASLREIQERLATMGYRARKYEDKTLSVTESPLVRCACRAGYMSGSCGALADRLEFIIADLERAERAREEANAEG